MRSGARKTASPTPHTAPASAACWQQSTPRAAHAPSHPVYEADSVDPQDPQPVVKLPHQTGYKLGALDNARTLFRNALGLTSAEWDVPLEETAP